MRALHPRRIPQLWERRASKTQVKKVSCPEKVQTCWWASSLTRVQECRLDYVQGLVRRTKVSPKSYYDYFQSKVAVRASVGCVKPEWGADVTTNKEKTQTFLWFFGKLRIADSGNTPQLPTNADLPVMVDVIITAKAVGKELARLDIHKAAGTDGVLLALLRPLTDVLAGSPSALIGWVLGKS
ncbi:hypothetical protein EG68_05806 [Paragonimus skrjabini miyazakii]|uniref:Uncharacterized protein n=1 Tax=Paragonimus skrjabini miyazakii TaxID=59628 RepID=A0A8S9YPV6_9TREM|nr:hypothetical protein EG68_05806 [Paragonimus skrjabini miyazakii]